MRLERAKATGRFSLAIQPGPILGSMSDLRERLQAALGDAYRVEKELGGGGMSRVFAAQDQELGRRVAGALRQSGPAKVWSVKAEPWGERTAS